MWASLSIISFRSNMCSKFSFSWPFNKYHVAIAYQTNIRRGTKYQDGLQQQDKDLFIWRDITIELRSTEEFGVSDINLFMTT